MTATTARGITYPTGTDAVTPLPSKFATLATTTNTAIDNAFLPVASFKGLDATRLALGAGTIPILTEGLEWYSTDTNLRWFYDGSAWIVSEPGTFMVRPTSVTGGSVGADGTVTWTGVTSVSINGIFSAAYEDYLVKIDVDSANAPVYYRARMRASGVDFTTAAYAEFYQIISSVTPAYDYSLSRTSVLLGYTDNTSLSNSSCELRVGGPFRSGHNFTRLQSTAVSQERMVTSSGGARTSTVFDGLTLLPDSGAFTGRARIFGFRGV